MSNRRGRQGPSDPQDIARRRLDAGRQLAEQQHLKDAEKRAADREAQRDPANWQIANDTVRLPTGEAVQVVPGSRTRVVRARRADPFETLLRAKALTQLQFDAAQRLFKLWCESMGVKTEDAGPIREVVQRASSAEMIPQRQIDAGRRYKFILSYVGPSTAKLFDVLMTPAVMCGSVVIWRAVVEDIAAEKDKHAQASVIRQACENLRMAFEVYDLRYARGELEDALRRRALDDYLVAAEA